MKCGKITINTDRCKGCNLCVAECKKGEIVPGSHINKGGYTIVEFAANGKCNACTMCAIICPDAAIEVYEEDEK
jgi:2-oxoglutarate ferredoxin oxidoreductase subunit delta